MNPRKTIQAGLAGLALSLIAGSGLILLLLYPSGEVYTIKGPGQSRVAIEKPGIYYVSYLFKTEYGGQIYDQQAQLPPDTIFYLAEAESNRQVALHQDTSLQQAGSCSVGYFEVTQPGQYKLSIRNFEESRIFSLGPTLKGNVTHHFLSLICIGLSAMLCSTLSVGVLSWGIIARKPGKVSMA